MYQLWITISALISVIVGLQYILGRSTTWHIALVLVVFVAFAQMICLRFLPESPKFLLFFSENEEKSIQGIKFIFCKKNFFNF